MKVFVRYDIDKPEDRWEVVEVTTSAALEGFFSGIHYANDFGTHHFDFNKDYQSLGIHSAYHLLHQKNGEIRIGDMFYSLEMTP